MQTHAQADVAVRGRYGKAAQAVEPALCCPVDYDPRFLEVIPEEVLHRDYGCGDPSAYLEPGETVLDLGSGTGKICFIASQVVGPSGSVIGVDMTGEMLDVARRAVPVVAERIGYGNVDFRRGRIQDLGLDLDQLDRALGENPIIDAEGAIALQELTDRLRQEQPLVADDTIDVVVSNCVLNLVATADKQQLFDEIYRVLRKGGRAVISDIVSDEPVTEEMMRDPDLWSGCLSGAFTEVAFLEAFERAGFHGIRVRERQPEPWQTVEGIEFRSVTIEAFKGKEGPCWERNQAVIYEGPFKEVLDDDGHRMVRGHRYAVCEKTFELYKQAPYSDHFSFIEPRVAVAPEQAESFDCSRTVLRHPRETKGEDYDATTEAKACCEPGACC